MVGWGRGRGQSGKDTTSDYRALDVRGLQRDGLLTPGRSFGWEWGLMTCRRAVNLFRKMHRIGVRYGFWPLLVVVKKAVCNGISGGLVLHAPINGNGSLLSIIDLIASGSIEIFLTHLVRMPAL